MGQGLVREPVSTTADGGDPVAQSTEAEAGTGVSSPSAAKAQSPVLEQYLAAKREHPDAVLLFRLGDFFETFQEDAEVAHQVLGITLTSRDFGRAGRHPMAGFPQHAAEGYIGRLLAGGHKVAVCDQVEEASAAKGLVRREVVRVLTPGTIVEGALLDPARENPLVSLTWDDNQIGLALLEVSTGRVELTEFPVSRLAVLGEVLARISPSELLVAEDAETAVAAFRSGAGEAWNLSPLEGWRFEATRGRQRTLEALGVASLAGFDCDDLGPALGALGAAFDYLARNHLQLPRDVIRLRRTRVGATMHLDAATIANLELVDSLGGGGRGLLDQLDRTRSPMGARRLRQWLLSPLIDVAAIDDRLAAVSVLVQDDGLRQSISAALKRVRDLERLTTRTAQGRAAPRDLGAIRDSLPALADLSQTLLAQSGDALAGPREAIRPEPDLARLLTSALEDSLPPTSGEGGIIRPGYDARLDELRSSIRDAQAWIAALEQRERDASGIKGIKVGFNRVFGYYLEISNANRLPVPDSYQRKQTLAGAERYITPELKEKESVVLNGEQAIYAREREVFIELCAVVTRSAPGLLRSAEAIGDLDALHSLAAAAMENGWSRPEVFDGYEIEIQGGRHPLVEAALGPGNFVANDLSLDEDRRVMLLTGPNMAGKSTYLRQCGILVVLAQVGSFVPATRAQVGVVDRVFTRVGAHDAIASGLSTFMVEMVETANILNHATSRSLLVIDEIGRGTSTYDGISIAQAVVEHIHDAPRLGCKTLFATHFHELTALAERLPALRNHRVEVSEEGGRVTFLHRIVPGGADRSYGIHVAEIAGLPAVVTARARELLTGLEASKPLAGATGAKDQLSLPIEVTHPLVTELAGIEIESLSPLEALNQLARLKSLGRDADEASRPS
ncbi:MAG TPA: DNA mismatch repair protein MutS [Candidatus Solibacter sp.]|jgi:DNA mismatch repair protein MutS|nr:DNA mismatch repair protein MutS [Candidatus Solibacter sp.]